MPDNPGREILQVEGVMESCDKDLQEILKRDTEIEQDRLKGCLDLSGELSWREDSRE